MRKSSCSSNSNKYRGHTYRVLPRLKRLDNSVPLFIAWASNIPPDYTSQLDTLCEWLKSRDGFELYEHLLDEIQQSHTVEQLALIMAAITNYQKFVPGITNDYCQPIQGSHLADFDGHLRDRTSEYIAVPATQMIVALLRVLYTNHELHHDLVAFLESVFTIESLLPHVHDGLSDQYWELRIDRQTHETAFKAVVDDVA